MYREMGKIDSPILLVIQDTNGAVFGALTSHPLRTSDLFYGTGESFLFTFYPDFEKFGWTGHNQYFIKGNSDSLVIGAGKYVPPFFPSVTSASQSSGFTDASLILCLPVLSYLSLCVLPFFWHS